MNAKLDICSTIGGGLECISTLKYRLRLVIYLVSLILIGFLIYGTKIQTTPILDLVINFLFGIKCIFTNILLRGNFSFCSLLLIDDFILVLSNCNMLKYTTYGNILFLSCISKRKTNLTFTFLYLFLEIQATANFPLF